MSDYYTAGMSGRSGKPAGEAVGVSAFPAEIGARLLNLAGAVVALDKDIGSSDKVDASFKDRWNQWKLDFKRWGDDWWTSSWIGRVLGNTAEMLAVYEKQYEAWKAEFAGLGGKSAATTPTKLEEPKPKAKPSGGTPWWGYVLMVGIPAAILLGVYAWARGSGETTTLLLPK